MKTLKCPYCSAEAKYTDSAEVYGRSFGMIYLCKPCDAYVGVHQGTSKPLGRLANKELRALKMAAHFHFDPLWKKKMQEGFRKGQARSMAYAWLASAMKIDTSQAHIGMFDVEQCKQVIELCKPYSLINH